MEEARIEERVRELNRCQSIAHRRRRSLQRPFNRGSNRPGSV